MWILIIAHMRMTFLRNFTSIYNYMIYNGYLEPFRFGCSVVRSFSVFVKFQQSRAHVRNGQNQGMQNAKT
jgi:hypothetical protein